jgi:hypothetical protein
MTVYYSVDQYGIYRKHDGDVLTVIAVDESSQTYQDMRAWAVLAGAYERYIADAEYKPKPLLPAYKIVAKQLLADKADAFIERITLAAGIPKSEVANFEAKAQAALAYVYQHVPIPAYSAIHQEASVTGEAIDDLCAKIVERVQQKEWMNGQISGMRRTAGWAIDAAVDHAAVDATVAAALEHAKKVLGGFAV